MEIIDLRKELKKLYSPKGTPEIIDVPELNYLTYTGRGEPGGNSYNEALNALSRRAWDEPRSQKALHGFVEERGYNLRGHHHEIYMSDPRRTPLDKGKTILRQLIEKT